ncbi:hypothetical protein [Terasakiella pusilla]|uniref:hypothetical protein n=1 Tax=Terasakiella pusilla TaxID=64973 RepID=UPI003AA87B81
MKYKQTFLEKHGKVVGLIILGCSLAAAFLFVYYEQVEKAEKKNLPSISEATK